MILGYETIINKIIEQTQLSKQEIELKIQGKLNELQGLISKEGAAHIVANSHNVKLFDSTPRTLKISNLQIGLNYVNLVVRILTIYDIRTFARNNKERRVANILIGDETGTTRLVIWDEKLIDRIQNMKEGDILKIVNGQSRENNGSIEIHLSNKAELDINPEGETIGEIKITIKSNKKQIKDVNENEFVELQGTLVQIFEPRFYNACPVCRKKVVEQENKISCVEHGEISPNKVAILNIILDDSTETIRLVLFRDLAEKLIKNEENFEKIKKENLGKQLVVKGRVRKNEMYQNLELIANDMHEANPEEILKDLEGQNI